MRRAPSPAHTIKDLYRLGIYESRIQSRRNAAALRAFDRAIHTYHDLPDEERERRHDLRPAYIRCLYAASRAALDLDRPRDARRYIFACIREDERTNHVAPVFKLFRAGKVCVATGELEHAERAFRLALDANGPPQRDFIYGALAELALSQDRAADAEAWIETHLRPHRRPAWIWRLLGDILVVQKRPSDAIAAYENALKRDRGGRHLTLVRLGDLHLAAGRRKQAARAYSDAAKFRQRRYLSEDPDALLGLLSIAEANNDCAGAEDLQRRLRASTTRARRPKPQPPQPPAQGREPQPPQPPQPPQAAPPAPDPTPNTTGKLIPFARPQRSSAPPSDPDGEA